MDTQFADDAAVITDSLSDMQLLLNFCQCWTAWSDLTIRPDKSFAYGVAQRNGHYQQIQPTLVVNGVIMPTIQLGGFMIYLGCRFSFMADLTLAKTILTDLTNQCISLVDVLPVIPLQKCHALNLQLRAHLSFPRSTYSYSLLCIPDLD